MNVGVQDIWKRIGFDDDDNPEKIIHEVDLNVLTLVNKHITKEDPTTLVSLGRKGSHLIIHYKTQIEEQGFSSCLYRLFASKYIESRPDISRVSPVIIVTDTIHTGTEMSNVLIYLYNDDIKVKKIFCYLINEEGLQAILNKGLITNDMVNGLFSSSSEEEYLRESRNLQVFFRSRIQPMDPDICFNLYNVNKKLSKEDVRSIFKPLFEDFFKTNVTSEKSFERGFPSNIEEINFSIEENLTLDEIKREIFQEDFDTDIDGLNIRFKINKKTVDSDFTIIMKPENFSDPETYKNAEKHLKNIEKCLLTQYKYEGKEEEVKKIICPACINISLSDKILNTIHPELIKDFEKKGLKCVLKWAYRPFKIYYPE